MTINEIKWLIEALAKYSVGGLVAGGVMFLLFKNYVSSYLNEKGANLAKKEDIAELTKLVKHVEHGYNILIEEMKAKQQLRMAAVDKRLQAHQEAFALWRRLVASETEDGPHMVIQCQKWWDNNCLYLEPNVRQAFLAAYTNSALQDRLLAAHADSKDILEAWNVVVSFQSVLFDSVQLPALSPAEAKEVIPAIESRQTPTTV